MEFPRKIDGWATLAAYGRAVGITRQAARVRARMGKVAPVYLPGHIRPVAWIPHE